MSSVFGGIVAVSTRFSTASVPRCALIRPASARSHRSVLLCTAMPRPVPLRHTRWSALGHFTPLCPALSHCLALSHCVPLCSALPRSAPFCPPLSRCLALSRSAPFCPALSRSAPLCSALSPRSVLFVLTEPRTTTGDVDFTPVHYCCHITQRAVTSVWHAKISRLWSTYDSSAGYLGSTRCNIPHIVG